MCENKGCYFPDYIKGEDWDYYPEIIGCNKCKEKCYSDAKCGGVECGAGYCSWWKVGKCSTPQEYTRTDYTCRKIGTWFAKNNYVINRFS